jgi:hypothetical protein
MKVEERNEGLFNSTRYLKIQVESEDVGKIFVIKPKLSPGLGGPSVLFHGLTIDVESNDNHLQKCKVCGEQANLKVLEGSNHYSTAEAAYRAKLPIGYYCSEHVPQGSILA